MKLKKALLLFVVLLVAFFFVGALDINVNSPANVTWTNTNTPTFWFNATSDVNTSFSCTLYIDNLPYGFNSSTLNNTPTNITTNATLTQGSRNWYVNCTDAMGTNKSAVSILYVDTTAPTVASLNEPSNNSYVNTSLVDFNFTSYDNLDSIVSYTLFLNQKTNKTGLTVGNNSATSFNVSYIPNGVYNWTIQLADDAGNSQNYTGYYYFTLDTSGPTSNIDSPANDTWTTDPTPEIFFTLIDNFDTILNYTIFVDGTADIGGLATNNTQTNRNLTSLANGTHSIVVEAFDGGTRVNSSILILSVDTVNPNSIINSPSNGSWVSDPTPELLFTLTDNLDSVLNYTVFVDGSSESTGVINNGTQTSYNTSTTTNGTHYAVIETFDNAGNRVNSSVRFYNIDTIDPTSNITSPSNGTLTQDNTPEITMLLTDVFDSVLNYTIYVNGAAAATGSVDNNTATALNLSTLSDGQQIIVVEARDEANNRFNSTPLYITVDTANPYENTGPTAYDPDNYFSLGNLFNLSINVTDDTSSLNNVTFDLSDICSGVSVTKTSAENGLWWANCSVDVSLMFQPRNITWTACDTAGNCNSSFWYGAILYNFSYPPGMPGFMSFDTSLTTNLSAEQDLNSVNYVIAMNLNGSQLPGQPWTGFKLTSYMNFSNLNFTDPQTGQDLQNLEGAIDIIIQNPKAGSYGGTRLYVNESLFAALDTQTNVILYNLPFTSIDASDLVNDTGGTGEISNMVFSSNGDGTGNLSFTVTGFSGYNISDMTNPIITVYSPGNDSLGLSLLFNATFNGTGTEIDNSSINLTLKSASTNYYYSFNNMTCTASNNNELLDCYVTPTLPDAIYNYTIFVKDYGGASGNSATGYGDNITINTLQTPTPQDLLNISQGDSWITLNWTPTSAEKYLIYENGTNLYNSTNPIYNVTGLINGAEYSYNITAYNSSNGIPESNFSNTITTTTILVVTCYGINSTDIGNVCSGKGTCTALDTCICNGGWGGSFCQFFNWERPPVPQNLLNQSQNNQSIYLNWTDITNVSKFLIYQDSSNLYNTTNNYYNVTGLTNNTQYSFNVTSYNSSYPYAESNFSNTITITTDQNPTDTTPPDTAPNLTSVADSDSDGNIELAWTNDTNAATFRIYRASANITDATGMTYIRQLAALSFEDNTTANGTTYWYAITSLDTNENENKTIVSNSLFALANDSITPRLPASVSASTSAEGSVAVIWDTVLLDVQGNADINVTYYVYRTTNITALNTSSSSERLSTTTSTSYTDTSITTGTNYTYVITVVDDASNHNSSKTATKNIVPSACTSAYTYGAWTTCSGGSQTRSGTRTCYGGGDTSATESQSCSSGGGGGSSSRRGSSAETVANPRAVMKWLEMGKESPTVMKIVNEELGFTQITINVRNPVKNVQITIEKMPGKPATVTHVASGKVYQYLKIDKTNIDDSDLRGKAVIRFKVTKAWLEENDIDPENIVLMRYTNEWKELFTEKVMTSATHFHYEAHTPGFSYFAIAERLFEEPEEQEVTAEVVEEVEPIVEEILPAEPEPIQEVKPKKNTALLATVLTVLLLVAGVSIYFFGKRKKEFDF